MIMLIDCPKCGARHEWNTDNKDQRCPRCVVMMGGDVSAILVELRKTKIPGQEPILRVIEVLNEKIKLLEGKAAASGAKT